MLRWTLPLIAFGAVVVTPALAADAALPPNKRVYISARQLPPGLPRAQYKYRTTVAPAYREPLHIDADPDALISPAYGPGSYVDNLPGTPILPGSSTIPGYYGRAFSYD